MTHILIPREPSAALLRPFIGCNTQELHEAWAAMVRAAEVQNARAGAAPAEVVGWLHPQWAAEQGRGRIYGHNPGGYIAVQIAAPQAPAAPAVDAETVKKAARYDHLRDCNSGSLVVVQITGTGEDDWHVLTEGDADEAIDTALAAQAKEAVRDAE
ncbi:MULTISPECIES: hypothetical protein [Delftia]|uniref:Uncharacterized protein n=1 Tax=Delftia lacustris TaxID=558537 RepID=A0A7T2YXC3_9BURK|nr:MULTISPECIES: hypothetical protein [Delftia]EPD40886.1 hypothetical protein HMPREF9702_03455 [Delftia acidovorans CCUG 15835]QPS83321.1 hypothetical protein I6G47_09740 [Delftia lacustris]